MLKRIPYLVIISATGLSLGWMATAPAQPSPGKKGDKKGDDIARFEDRLKRLRWQFGQPEPDLERRTLLTWSASYANRAEQFRRAGQPYIADRTLAPRLLSMLAIISNILNMPPARLRRLPRPFRAISRMCIFARGRRITSCRKFTTMRRLRSYHSRVNTISALFNPTTIRIFRAADEYGKMAEELVRALESLAQAATLAPQPLR